MENVARSRSRRALTVLGMLTLTLGIAGGRAQALPTLFPTGVDNSGALLPLGAADPHYLSLTTVSSAFVQNTPNGAWATSAVSRWIGNTAASPAMGSGFTTFRVTFTLTAAEAASPLLLSGEYAADDVGEIYLNGNLTSLGATSYPSFNSFSRNFGFIAGTNFLDFVVDNAVGTQGGLNVRQVSIVSAAPEPTTLALLALGGLVILGKRFRREG